MKKKPILTNRLGLIIRVLISTLFSVLTPLILDQLPLPIFSNTYGKYYQVFEYFGFSTGLVLILNIIWEIRKIKPQEWEGYFRIIIPFGVAFFYLIFISEYSIQAWDYSCYVKAAEGILAGANVYGDCYLYPPLIAQVLAAVHQVINAAALGIGQHPTEATVWRTVFYLYQCAQYGLILVTYTLCIIFAKRVRFSNLGALGLVTILFIVNNPLIRTLRHNQINLWVLVFSLIAILLIESRPFWAGIAVALGTHIKIYPIILLVPWTYAKKWRVLIGAVTGALLILFLSYFIFTTMDSWGQFINSLGLFKQGTYFRDNSIHSLMYNLVRFIMGGNAQNMENLALLVNLSTGLVTLGIISWFILRFLRAERILENKEKNIAHGMDALAISLLISPMVWEHHYIIIIPFVIWALATVSKENRWQVVLAAMGVLALPTFDIFPLSYHRLACLVWLLILASPPKPSKAALEGLPT